MIAEVPVVAAPAAVEGIAGIALVFGFIVCIALQHGYRLTLKQLLLGLAAAIDGIAFHVSGFRIGVPKAVGAEIRSLADAIDHGLGAAAVFCEHKATWLFQQAWHLLVWTAREIRDLALTTEHALALAPTVTIGQIRKQIAAAEAYAAHRIATVEAELHREADRLFGKARHGIDVLTKKADVTIPRRIARAEARVGALEHELAGLKGNASRIARLLGIAAITTLVGTALERMGLRWLRCGNVKRLGKGVCRMDSRWLDLLFASSLDVLVAADLCRITDAVETAAEAAVPAFNYLAMHIPDLIECQQASRPPKMHVKLYAPPAVSPFVTAPGGV